MLKPWIKIVICILITNVCISQEHRDTSITTYIDSINKLSSCEDKLLEEVKKKILQYDTVIYAKELGNAYHKLGFFHYKNKNYLQAIEHTQKAVQFRQKTRDTLALNNSLNNLIYYYENLKVDTSREQLAISEKIIGNKAHDNFTYVTYNKAAGLYIDKGDFYKALHYYENVIQSYETYHNNIEELVLAHMGSIEVYDKLKINSNQLNTIQYHSNEIEKYSKNAYDEDLASNNNNLGNIYEHLNFDKEAIVYYNKAGSGLNQLKCLY